MVNKWWICNDGRYDYRHVHDGQRITVRRRREAGRAVELDWAGVAAELRRRLTEAGRLAAVLSPFLTVEEAYLLVKLRAADRSAGGVGAGPGARRSARTSGSPADSPSPRRNAPTAAAWR